jgi:GTP cyclohydrolase I
VTRAVIGLGSNIEPGVNLSASMRALRRHPRIAVLETASCYASPAVGRPDDPDFVNSAVLVDTTLDPAGLRAELRAIEEALGRSRSDDRFAPRTIDLDILLFEGFSGEVEGSVVPDPDLEKHAHVAVPAAEVAPEWAYEPGGRSLKSIADSLDASLLEQVMTTDLSPLDKNARYAPESHMEASEDEVWDPEREANVREMLLLLGEDPQREGLIRTPLRVAKAMDFLTSGYNGTVEQVVNNAIFESDADEMVLVKDIEFYSLCEHHVLPFFGSAHVAYIPNGRVVGLSKVARIVDLFSRRLQIQERLTNQIADAVHRVLDPHGVAVVMEGAHFCMMMRGVQKQGSSMITSAMRGGFKTNPSTRSEFMELISD